MTPAYTDPVWELTPEEIAALRDEAGAERADQELHGESDEHDD